MDEKVREALNQIIVPKSEKENETNYHYWVFTNIGEDIKPIYRFNKDKAYSICNTMSNQEKYLLNLPEESILHYFGVSPKDILEVVKYGSMYSVRGGIFTETQSENSNDAPQPTGYQFSTMLEYPLRGPMKNMLLKEIGITHSNCRDYKSLVLASKEAKKREVSSKELPLLLGSLKVNRIVCNSVVMDHIKKLGNFEANTPQGRSGVYLAGHLKGVEDIEVYAYPSIVNIIGKNSILCVYKDENKDNIIFNTVIELACVLTYPNTTQKDKLCTVESHKIVDTDNITLVEIV